jgi:hypothetical protein
MCLKWLQKKVLWLPQHMDFYLPCDFSYKTLEIGCFWQADLFTEQELCRMTGNVIGISNWNTFAESAIQTVDKRSVISLLNVNLCIVYIDALECKSHSLESCTVHRQLQCIDAAWNCANLGTLLYICRIVWIGYRSCEGVYIAEGETSCGTYRELNRGPRTKQYWQNCCRSHKTSPCGELIAF